MQKALSFRIGRLRLRPYDQACPYNINRCAVGLSTPPVKSYRSKANSATSPTLDLPALDKKWRKIWEEQAQAGGSLGKREALDTVSMEGERMREAMGKKMYILPMFPYPSGNLHLGHFRNYTIPDVLARFRRMQGYNVLLPMGWDAFGLPAENAAIERGINPAVWTADNISKMKAQLRVMNGSWDWSRELTTCDPSYYKHTQRIFLLLYEHGLAYQAESLVNYDPIDRTVLANEQVDANGCSWRSGAKVEKKLLKQWFLRISAFRDSLLEDLDLLAKDGRWPERVLSMQRNWLGKSKGARIRFQVMTYDRLTHKPIEVFTTRPDTLFGVQYIALAATHPLIVELSKTDAGLQAFLDTMASLPQDSKVGFLLSTVRAINPLAFDPSTPDATKASLPIYVAPYVLADYGDGAVMGVPGHDNRDNTFWKQNRGEEPIQIVIKESSAVSEDLITQEPFTHQGILTSKSGVFAGKRSAEAAQEIVELLKLNELAEPAETWRLRDWLISRQRYWGAPIPIIHCTSCGPVPVPVDQLPVELPSVDGHWLRSGTGNPLDDANEWVNTPCPRCNSPAKRDTDTMDTFVDSSWYFMRFADPNNKEAPFSPEAANAMLPVDLYIGGVEHAILHLLYARFISKFLAKTSLWPAGASSQMHGEPFKKLLTQGMVHGKTYTDPSTGRFLKPDEVDLSAPSNPIVVATGETAKLTFEKMSKSKYNGVDPTACIEKYGADATRAHMLFQAPPSEVLEWDEEKIAGVTRWLKKLHDYVCRSRGFMSSLQTVNSKSYFMKKIPAVDSLNKARSLVWNKEVDLWLSVQRTIVSVTESMSETKSLNTVVSDLMTLSNTVIHSEDCNPVIRAHALSALIRMMAPITPAFSEECWKTLHNSESRLLSVLNEPFPEADGTLEILKTTSHVCAVQINGKRRFATEIPKPPSELAGADLTGWIIEQILSTEEGKIRLIERGIDIKNAKKVIVVKGGRTVNFVL